MKDSLCFHACNYKCDVVQARQSPLWVEVKEQLLVIIIREM